MVVQVIRCAIYCRISWDWEGKGLGVQRQLEDCLAIAKRLGWTVVDHYIDNDTGASRYSKKKTREQYNRLLADIEAGRIDAVVIWGHLDGRPLAAPGHRAGRVLEGL